jgi:hypothetical protein
MAHEELVDEAYVEADAAERMEFHKLASLLRRLAAALEEQ